MAARNALVLLLTLLLTAPVLAQSPQLREAYERAFALHAQDRFAEAAPHYARAVELAEREYGADAPDLAIDLNNLAELYRRLGRLDEAQPLYERAIAIDSAAFGASSPVVAITRNNLALLHQAAGRPAEAEALYRQALDAFERAYGDSHPDHLRTVNNYATLMRDTGREQDARALLSRALVAAEGTLGAAHRTTRAIRGNLDGLGAPEEVATAQGPAPPAPEPTAPPGPTAPLGPAAEAPATTATPEPPRATAAALDPPPVPARRPELEEMRIAALPAEPAPEPVPEPVAEPEAAPIPEAAPEPPAEVAADPPAVPARRPAREARTVDVTGPATQATADETRTAAVSSSGSGGFAAHLSSVDQPVAMDGEWRRLQHLYPDVLGELEPAPGTVDLGERGVFFRVRAGPFAEQDAAQAVCARLLARDQYCVVVPF